MNLFRKVPIYILLTISINAFAQTDKGLKTINGKEVMLHKVLTKETWTGIARTYNLSIEDVKSVNPGIADLKEGQIINVPLMPSLPSAKAETPANKPVVVTKPAAVAITNANDIIVNPVTSNATNSNTTKHTVKEKETLFGISKMYGVKVDDLKKWNNNIATVKIGQIINVKDPLVQKSADIAKTNTDKKETAKKEMAVIPVQNKVEVKSDVKEKPLPAKTEIKPKSITDTKPESKNQAKPEAKAETITTEKASVNNDRSDAKPEESIATKPAKTDKTESTQKNMVLDNEQKSVTSKPDVKNSNGSVVREYNETGMAAWIKDGSLNQNKYYALHRTAPLGTIVKVNNRMNGDYVFVKVVGQLPDTGDNDKQIIKISEAAARKIGAVNEHFQVELSYGVLN